MIDSKETYTIVPQDISIISSSKAYILKKERKISTKTFNTFEKHDMYGRSLEYRLYGSFDTKVVILYRTFFNIPIYRLFLGLPILCKKFTYNTPIKFDKNLKKYNKIKILLESNKFFSGAGPRKLILPISEFMFCALIRWSDTTLDEKYSKFVKNVYSFNKKLLTPEFQTVDIIGNTYE